MLPQQQKNDPPPGTLVTLPDGRVVKWDPDPAKRSLCVELCPESIITVEHNVRRFSPWWFAAGAIAVPFLMNRGRASAAPIRAQQQQLADLPELGTLLLLGTGLVLIARKVRYGKGSDNA